MARCQPTNYNQRLFRNRLFAHLNFTLFSSCIGPFILCLTLTQGGYKVTCNNATLQTFNPILIFDPIVTRDNLHQSNQNLPGLIDAYCSRLKEICGVEASLLVTTHRVPLCSVNTSSCRWHWAPGPDHWPDHWCGGAPGDPGPRDHWSHCPRLLRWKKKDYWYKEPTLGGKGDIRFHLAHCPMRVTLLSSQPMRSSIRNVSHPAEQEMMKLPAQVCGECVM